MKLEKKSRKKCFFYGNEGNTMIKFMRRLFYSGKRLEALKRSVL